MVLAMAIALPGCDRIYGLIGITRVAVNVEQQPGSKSAEALICGRSASLRRTHSGFSAAVRNPCGLSPVVVVRFEGGRTVECNESHLHWKLGQPHKFVLEADECHFAWK